MLSLPIGMVKGYGRLVLLHIGGEHWDPMSLAYIALPLLR